MTRAVEVLGGKWKLHIVYHLMDGTKRFSKLGRAIPGTTQQMLTAQLRVLKHDGIVTRPVYPVVPRWKMRSATLVPSSGRLPAHLQSGGRRLSWRAPAPMNVPTPSQPETQRENGTSARRLSPLST